VEGYLLFINVVQEIFIHHQCYQEEKRLFNPSTSKKQQGSGGTNTP